MEKYTTLTVNDQNFDVYRKIASEDQKQRVYNFFITFDGKEHVMRAKHTMQAQNDLKEFHGLSAEKELMAILEEELEAEIKLLLETE